MKATGIKYLQMMRTKEELDKTTVNKITVDKIHNMQLGTGTMTICNIDNLPNGPMKVVANWR